MIEIIGEQGGNLLIPPSSMRLQQLLGNFIVGVSQQLSSLFIDNIARQRFPRVENQTGHQAV